MAHFPYLHNLILLGTMDLSSDMTSVTIARTQEGLSDDTFSPTKAFKARMGGLGDAVVGMAGLINLGDGTPAVPTEDSTMFANMSLTGLPLLVSFPGGADFDRCKFGKVQQGTYQPGGNVGQRAEWTAEARISAGVFTDGNIMATGAKTTTFNGVARQLGALSATQKLYAVLFATAKTTFTSAVFKIQSDDNSGFTTPTDRITFTTVTGLTSEMPAAVSGAITDDWWRVTCSSFTGTSLTVYIAMGIAGF